MYCKSIILFTYYYAMLYHPSPRTSAPSLHHKAHFLSHHALVEGVSLSKSFFFFFPSNRKSVAPNQRHSTNKTRLETTTSKPLVEVPNQAQTPTRDAFPDRSQIQLRIIAFPPRLWSLGYGGSNSRLPSSVAHPLSCKFPHCPAARTTTQCLCVIHRLRNQESGNSPPFTSRQGIAYHSIGITSPRACCRLDERGRCELDEPISLFLLLSLYIST